MDYDCVNIGANPSVAITALAERAMGLVPARTGGQ